LKNWLVMLTLLKGRVMPKYVAGKDFKNSKERLFNLTETDYLSKKAVVKKVIERLNGRHRKSFLEKAFRKLSVEEVATIGNLVDTTIKREVGVIQDKLNSKCKDII